MTSLERVIKAVHFGKPDKVPNFLPDGKENDLIWLWPTRPVIQKWKLEADGMERQIDAWGTVYERVAGNNLAHGEKCKIAIENIDRQAEYAFPNFLKEEYFENNRKTIQANATAANPKYCLGVMPYPSLNEGTHNLIELDRMFYAYYESPNELKELIMRLADAQMKSIKMLAEIGCNGVMGYDDWGLQDRKMINDELIDEFFMPLYKRNWNYAHSLGLDVWLHSCGYVIDLLPKFKSWGLDVIQMDQQENMGLENLASKIGGKLAFWCPVDIQKTLATGTEEEIRSYVRSMRNTIGNYNGGLISMSYSTPSSINLRQENIIAMCDEFRKLKSY